MRSPTRSRIARWRARRVSPRKCSDTIVSEKCPAPDAAPAWPTCFPLSSRISRTLGARGASRAVSAALASTVTAIAHSLLRRLRDVSCEKNALHEREREEQADAAPNLEVDPCFGRKME